MNNCSLLRQERSFRPRTTVPRVRPIVLGMKKRPKTRATIAANIKMLIKEWPMQIDELAQKSGVTKRMIQYVISQERAPSIEIADAIATAFGISGWQLLIPDLRSDLVRQGKLTALVTNYGNASFKAREYIDEVAGQAGKTNNGGKAS